MSETESGTPLEYPESVSTEFAKYLRPTEVEEYCGDATRAAANPGWEPQVRFAALVRLMLEHGLREARIAQVAAVTARADEEGTKASVNATNFEAPRMGSSESEHVRVGRVGAASSETPGPGNLRVTDRNSGKLRP